MSVVSPAVASAADLGLGLAATHVGSTLSYALTVTNRGPSPATNVSLSDAVPAGTGLRRIARSAFVCRPSRSGTAAGTLTCRLARLAPGAKAVLRISLSLRRGHGPRVIEMASVASAVFDPHAANNRASVITRVG